MEKLYTILEVQQSASYDEIKKSYHALIKKYHPDSKTGNVNKFLEVQTAYDILSDPKKREEYDKTLGTKKNFTDYDNDDNFQYHYSASNIGDLLEKILNTGDLELLKAFVKYFISPEKCKKIVAEYYMQKLLPFIYLEKKEKLKDAIEVLYSENMSDILEKICVLMNLIEKSGYKLAACFYLEHKYMLTKKQRELVEYFILHFSKKGVEFFISVKDVYELISSRNMKILINVRKQNIKFGEKERGFKK